MKNYLITVNSIKDGTQLGSGEEKANTYKEAIINCINELPPIMDTLIEDGKAKLIIQLGY
jgi:hypothetical protein